jgi:hypothetical protein
MMDSATIDKLGYWLVDGKHKFINKNVALEHCTKKKTKDIRYCLEEDRFSKANWHSEPTLSLTDLYRLRAQQIRDNYDHVVLTYSGGSDSTNILHSFITNGIKPDEVISFMLEGKDFSNEGTTFNKEITFNQNAIKQYVLSNNIKYSTVNISDFYNSIFHNEYWCYESGINRAYITARAHAAKLSRFKKLVDSGKKCCIVYGLEKPTISVDKNNNFYSFFLDIPLQQYNLNEMYHNSYNGLALERFYVSGDLPELTIKQSHIVANYYQQQFQKESKKMLQLGFEYDFRHYKEIVIDLLYSHSFDQKKCFTIGKSNYLTGLRDDWLVSLSNNDRRKMNVFNGWAAISKNIDKSFFNKNDWKHDTVGCISKSYYLNKKI